MPHLGPIGDPLETDMPHLGPIADPVETDMPHLGPIGTDMPDRRLIRDRHV